MHSYRHAVAGPGATTVPYPSNRAGMVDHCKRCPAAGGFCHMAGMVPNEGGMSLIPSAYCCYKDFIIALASSVGSKMIPYAMLRPGRGFQPGRAALYYAQRVVTEPRLRQGISRSIA